MPHTPAGISLGASPRHWRKRAATNAAALKMHGIWELPWCGNPRPRGSTPRSLRSWESGGWGVGVADLSQKPRIGPNVIRPQQMPFHR